MALNAGHKSPSRLGSCIFTGISLQQLRMCGVKGRSWVEAIKDAGSLKRLKRLYVNWSTTGKSDSMK